MAEISLFVRALFPADRRVYILLEKMTENDRVAKSLPFWLYQLEWRFCQVFEKASVDLTLACELRATILCALGRELNRVPAIRFFGRYSCDRINR
jgi:hypothetical protein